MQLQIPIRSVIKVSKEKTAKIIPNAVGLATATEKHVFGSLLSRDSTFKFMTHVWKRAVRGLQQGDEDDMGAPVEAVLETELDDDVAVVLRTVVTGGDEEDASSESDVGEGAAAVAAASQTVAVSSGGSTMLEPTTSPLESSYLVKRLSAASATAGAGVGGADGRQSLTPIRAANLTAARRVRIVVYVYLSEDHV